MVARLALFWFLYMGALGVFFPYFTLYLRETAGLSGGQAGIVFAMFPLTGLFAQPLWGQIADRTGRRNLWLGILVVAAAAGHAVFGMLEGFVPLVCGAVGIAFFATAIMPMGMSVSLGALGEGDVTAFGRVRVFGTFGFLAFVVAFPLLSRVAGGGSSTDGVTASGLELMFVVTSTTVLASALALWGLPESEVLGLRARRGDWRELLRHRPFSRYLVVAFVAYLSIHGPMVFFPVYVSAHGGDVGSVSQMWVLMLLPEIPLIAWAGRLHGWLGSRGLVAMGILAGGIRWLICGLGPDLPLIYAMQVLHGPLVAGMIVGGTLYVDAVVPPHLRSTGQSMLFMVGMGLGGMMSTLWTGWALERLGPDVPYLLGGVTAVILGIFGPLSLAHPSRPVPREPLVPPE